VAAPSPNRAIAEATRLERAGEWASRAASLRPADPSLRRGLYAGIGLLVALGVGFALATTLGELPKLEWRSEPLWLAAGIVAFIVLVLAEAEIWRRLLRALGPELGFVDAGTIWCASALGRYVPTSVLTPMVRVAMAERVGVPKRICFASIAYEIALWFTAALVIGAYFVTDLPDLQGDAVRFTALVVPALALACLHPRVFERVANVTLERLGREPLRQVLGFGHVLAFVGLYAGAFVIAGLSVFALAHSVYPVGGDDLVIVTGAFAVGTALSILAFVLPGGLVAREAGLAVALSPIMPTAPAIGVAVLARMTQIGVEVTLATVMPLIRAKTRA
jgi:hypothetical protein